MTFEQLVGDALHAADDYQPSADLFAKVQRSIEEDAAHRTRVRNVLVSMLVGLLVIVAYFALTVDVADGVVSMPFRALDVLATALMIAVVIVAGPAIRRFGKTYEGDAFSARRETGPHVLRLLDFSYYLIFGAYILMSMEFDPVSNIGPELADWLAGEFARIGGLLLLMGILHVLLLIALPVVGLVFSVNERRLRIVDGNVSIDEGANRIDRAVTVAAWVIAGIVVLQLVFAVLNVLVVIGPQG